MNRRHVRSSAREAAAWERRGVQGETAESLAATEGRPLRHYERMAATGGQRQGKRRWWVMGLVGVALLLTPETDRAYSVQSHEQLIDLAWHGSIVPLLMDRYPKTTAAQLLEAHAYAYGGSAIQDLGYYPFGNEFFSDLTHYVRAGDFVQSLLRNAKTVDELAFAVGALSHYVGDTVGHAAAVNLSVPKEFPALGMKYGPVVNYEESPHAHVRTEFAFDINEIEKRRFAPSGYLKHVGLNVATDLLARAFYEVYGLDLYKTIGDRRPILRGYRFAVRRFLPSIAYAETVLHRKSMPQDTTGSDIDRLEQRAEAGGLGKRVGAV